MDADDIDRLLDQLRRFRMDHQYVEVKRARSELPKDLWATMSAFANSTGGLILLGVDEGAGFTVSGVEAPDRIANELQMLATQSLEPPLRVTIDLVEHPGGIVVAARVPAVPRDERPCFYRQMGVIQGSFIRVGDGDHALSEQEVSELQATQRRGDASARPTAPGARLDNPLVREFCRRVREVTPDRYAKASDDAILRDWKAADL